MTYTHTYLHDLDAGTPLGMRVRIVAKYFLSEARTAQVINGLPTECDTPSEFEIERVYCYIDIDNAANPFHAVCLGGELHPDHWHFIGGEEGIELECRNRGPHLSDDDDCWPDHTTADEEYFYSMQRD